VDIPSLTIVKYPDARLREVSTPVESVDADLHPLTEKMFELMTAAQGVGLAAPQVGVTVRLFIISRQLESVEHHVYINPEILSVAGRQKEDEGCLSIPGITSKIARSAVVDIRATDLDGRSFEQRAEGLIARAFQHEMDHLNGRLIIDRMSTVARLANRKTIRELEEQASD